MTITKKEIEKIFNLWEKDIRENPDNWTDAGKSTIEKSAKVRTRVFLGFYKQIAKSEEI